MLLDVHLPIAPSILSHLDAHHVVGKLVSGHLLEVVLLSTAVLETALLLHWVAIHGVLAIYGGLAVSQISRDVADSAHSAGEADEVHLVNRLTSTFDHTDVAILVHRRDLALESIHEI